MNYKMGVIDGYPKYPVNDLRARQHVARGWPSALLTLTSPRRGCHQIFRSSNKCRFLSTVSIVKSPAKISCHQKCHHLDVSTVETNAGFVFSLSGDVLTIPVDLKEGDGSRSHQNSQMERGNPWISASWVWVSCGAPHLHHMLRYPQALGQGLVKSSAFIVPWHTPFSETARRNSHHSPSLPLSLSPSLSLSLSHLLSVRFLA